MKQELQDKAWRVLPAEFREEVKICYQYAYVQYGKSDLHRGSANAIESLFGHHNLTSDAEGEEMLTVPRKRVMEIYNHCNGGGAQVIEDIFGKLTYDMNNDAIITPLDKFKGLPHLNEKQEVITDYEGYAPTLYPYEGQWFVSWVSSEGDSILDFQAESPEKAIELAYNHLFGSKCLPDNVDSSEPNVDSSHDNVDSSEVNVDSLEPNSDGLNEDNFAKSEPTKEDSGLLKAESVKESRNASEESNLSNSSQDCDERFDTIIKRGFRADRRCNIAVQMIKAMMSCPEIIDRISSAEADSLLDDILHDALYLTDNLIAECEKGADQ